MKSKAIWLLLIFILMFNFIFTNSVYASDDDGIDLINSNDVIEYSEDEFNLLIDEGQTSRGDISTSTSQGAGTTGLFARMFAYITLVPLGIISLFVNSGGIYRTGSEYSADSFGWFNLGSLVFGEYLMFDVNVAKTSDTLNSDIESSTVASAIDGIKNITLSLYGIVNAACIVLFLIIAIYTFIKSFLSKTGAEKAKYKEMGNAWIRAIIFVILAIIIIMVINVVLDLTMDILYKFKVNLEDMGYASFENELFIDATQGYSNGKGFTALMYELELLAFLVIDIVFLGKYVIRSFMIFFLTVLAPVFAVIDVFNRLNGKGGMLNTWFNTYLSYIFIQPLHALMYLVFMMVGGNLVLRAPLAGIILLYALLLAEAIGRMMLDFSKNTLGSLFSRNNA